MEQVQVFREKAVDDELPFKLELIKQIGWLVRLRWIAIGGVFFTVTIASLVGDIISRPIPLYIIAAMMVLYNFEPQMYRKAPDQQRLSSIKRQACIHIILDLLSLTALIHFSGGVENPFIFYFVFHLIIASIILSKRVSYILAALNTVFLSSLIFLEYFEIIPHYSLKVFLPDGLWQNHVYIFGVLFVFTSTLFFSVYLATTITQTAREREADRKRMEQQLIFSEKMATIGELAAGVAHEINNPLDGLLNCILRIQRDPANVKQTQEYLDLMEEAIRRIEATIGKLLDFSRPHELLLTAVNINEVAKETIGFLEYGALEKGIHIETDFQEQIARLHGDKHLLEQVILNLSLNAITAMPKGGTLRFETGEMSLDTLIGQPIVFVKVIDTGIGISASVQDRIFDPFYTTQIMEKGTGLGLSVSDRIVRQHQGVIEVESEENKGSTFTVKLPIARVPRQEV